MADWLLLEGTALISNLCENDDKRHEALGNKKMTCSFKTEGKYGLHSGFAPAPGILKWVKQGKENKPTKQKNPPKNKADKKPTGVQFANFKICLFLQGDFQSHSSDRREAPFKPWFNVVIYMPKLSDLLTAVELHLIKFWLDGLVVKHAAYI